MKVNSERSTSMGFFGPPATLAKPMGWKEDFSVNYTRMMTHHDRCDSHLMARTPQSVTLSRELLLTLHDAQEEAAAAIGLRGENARRAMRREHERINADRWNAGLRAARRSEVRRANEDDYRSRVPASESVDADAEARGRSGDALDTVESGATRSGAESSAEDARGRATCAEDEDAARRSDEDAR